MGSALLESGDVDDPALFHGAVSAESGEVAANRVLQRGARNRGGLSPNKSHEIVYEAQVAASMVTSAALHIACHADPHRLLGVIVSELWVDMANHEFAILENSSDFSRTADQVDKARGSSRTAYHVVRRGATVLELDYERLMVDDIIVRVPNTPAVPIV